MASCARLHWISALAKPSFNFYGDIELLAIWTAIEPGMGITATSLATLRPLLRAFLQRPRDEKAGKSTRLRWPFAHFPSWRKPDDSITNSPTPSSGNTQTTGTKLGRTKATVRRFKPLNTFEAPDFLDITNTSNEHLPLERGYMQYNATPKLAHDV
jgi:hypothetical protein